jgi:diguanylate cyclase (GGDEF)-like protein
MNDLVSTLDRVNGRIARLASGEVDVAEADEVLPGAIGESLRDSFVHLANVTAQLHRSEGLASAIVAQADDAIWTTDADGIVLTANEASTRLTGLSISDQIRRALPSMLSRTDGEATVLTRSDVSPKVLVARSVIDTGDESVIAVIAHDISERSQFEERLNYQALHDALTGLPNRFALLEHLDEMSALHPGQIGVLYLDLDGFKAVNDVRGHAVGDRVLTEIADRLRRGVRDGEFIGRLGGDEFVVVTHRFVQSADLVALGHRLIREVELPIDDDGTFFSLSASVGVATPLGGTSPLAMIGQADNAVYQAKLRGKGRVEIFDAAMQDQLDNEAELELALSEAVRNDELVLHLQPITDLRTNRVDRAEALVRWMRPGHGMVSPADFIPIAERSALILEIERWVLMRVCQHLVAWRQRDPECTYRISVNISGRHLGDGDLLADIDAVLSMTGADPTMLELELTETRLLEDLNRTKSVLNELRSRGITIAIDDFGTGYSSMTYLRELPVDCLKIDRSFVAQATDYGYDSTVIEALLTIGHALNLIVVAEGVETEAQVEYLRSRGCQLAQGFLLARPMPVADAEAYMFAGAADDVWA